MTATPTTATSPRTRALLRALPALALLLAASPARGGDLTGLWRVEGTFPGGQGYQALAALNATAPDRYRVTARGTSADGRLLVWRATAERHGDELRMRHVGNGGLVARILDFLDDDPPALLGRYEVAADEQAFQGTFRLEGAAETGRDRYVREAAPRLTFDPPSLRLQPGQSATVRITADPAGALGLLYVERAGVTQVVTQGGARVARVGPLPAGPHAVRVRLGTNRGPVLGTLDVQVGASVLDRVVDAVRAHAAERPIVIFDLDDTLFDTRYRHREILSEYGRAEDDPRLVDADVGLFGYDIMATLPRLGLSPAEVDGALGRAIRRHWSRRFFSGLTYGFDRPIEGAVAFVGRLVAAGARIVYVTGRRESHRQACLDTLRAAGYPVDADNVRLFLPPDPIPGQPKEPTAQWKGRITREEVLPTGRVVAAFDNEPANCNAFRAALGPETFVTFIDTLYPPDSPALAERIETLPNFR